MSGNPYTPQFAPFQSGCSMCKPSSDYYQINSQVGSGNYSNDGLIPASNGKNLYSAKNYEMNLDQKFIKNNLGIDYATSFGGAKPKSKKPKSKKSLKGGEYGSFNLNEMHDESLLSGGKKPKKSTKSKGKKSVKGGDPLADLNKLLSMTQKSDEIMSGGKKSKGKKPIRKMKGGMESSSNSNGSTFF